LRVNAGPDGLPARIELDAADLRDIVSGRENPLKIAQTGRICVERLKSDETLRGLLQLVWGPSAPVAGSLPAAGSLVLLSSVEVGAEPLGTEQPTCESPQPKAQRATYFEAGPIEAVRKALEREPSRKIGVVCSLRLKV